MRPNPSTAELVEAARTGSPRAIARLISWVEEGHPLLGELSEALATAPTPQVVGLTGSPGVGKSTTTNALISSWRSEGARVAVLAVDPSSPFSGGALLGDRVRMTEHAADPDVYIRSMAARGHLGGLSAAAPQAIRVLGAAGFDVVLVETVGVGQSEVEVAGAADTTVVILAPGMGDGIQAAKAGILEIGDVYAVNKADRDGAEHVRKDLRSMLALAERSEDDWKPPIVLTTANSRGGIPELKQAISEHYAWLAESGTLHERRLARARAQIEALALERIRAGWSGAGESAVNELAGLVAEGRMDPYAAALRLSGIGRA